jgi:hypothetical protein
MQNQYHHLFTRNCFRYTRVFQRLVTRILPAGAQPGLHTNTHEDRNHIWYTLGKCFCLRADGSAPNSDEPDEPDEMEINALVVRYNEGYNLVSAGFFGYHDQYYIDFLLIVSRPLA